ncbi:MAG: hypothetical protein ABI315_01775 [Bacteroidia bacterium]
MGKKFLLISSLFLLLVTACKPKNERFISEGEIEYDAFVMDRENPMASLAPDKMTIKFKDDKICFEMNAGMGLFTTSFISDPPKKSITQLVKFLNKKFMLTQSREDVIKENENCGLEVIPTNETKLIAGYLCKKVKIKPKKKNEAEYAIYYTNELDVKKPNFINCYNMIDGVLMEYQMKKFGLEMKFTAQKVKNIEIDSKVFEIPSDYKKVTEKEMKAFFNDLN